MCACCVLAVCVYAASNSGERGWRDRSTSIQLDSGGHPFPGQFSAPSLKDYGCVQRWHHKFLDQLVCPYDPRNQCCLWGRVPILNPYHILLVQGLRSLGTFSDPRAFVSRLVCRQAPGPSASPPSSSCSWQPTTPPSTSCPSAKSPTQRPTASIT